jgi:RND family efflux transporter MFP subunit
MKRSTLLVVLTALLLVGLFGAKIASHQSKAAEPPKSAPEARAVDVAHPVRETLAQAVRFSGVVRPRNEVDVSGKVAGRVQQLRVEVGQVVKSGELIATIEHTELAFQSEQARAQVEAADAQVLSARIQVLSAQTQHERVTKLETGGAVAQADRERAELALKQAEAQYKAAEAQLRLSQATANLAGKAVQNSFITAPFGGTITKRMVSVGTQVGPGQPLVQVQDLAALKLAATVTAADFAKLVQGQPVSIRVEELLQATITGRIATLSPSLDPVTRRAQVEIAIDNSEGRLLANMFAHAEVMIGERKDVLVAPRSALVSLARGNVLYVVREQHVKAITMADAGSDPAWIPVDGLIEPSDAIVVRGQTGLSDGQVVHVTEAN